MHLHFKFDTIDKRGYIETFAIFELDEVLYILSENENCIVNSYGEGAQLDAIQDILDLIYDHDVIMLENNTKYEDFEDLIEDFTEEEKKDFKRLY